MKMRSRTYEVWSVIDGEDDVLTFKSYNQALRVMRQTNRPCQVIKVVDEEEIVMKETVWHSRRKQTLVEI